MSFNRSSIVRMICLLLAVGSMASCACRSRGGDNIPVAQEGMALKDINFAFDSYEVSKGAQATLAANAGWLKENPDVKIEVEGHCDERGTHEYNMALGNKRAKAAADYLRSLGISADRMSEVSYGKQLPLDPRHNEEAWAKNRRAHFDIVE